MCESPSTGVPPQARAAPRRMRGIVAGRDRAPRPVHALLGRFARGETTSSNAPRRFELVDEVVDVLERLPATTSDIATTSVLG